MTQWFDIIWTSSVVAADSELDECQFVNLEHFRINLNLNKSKLPKLTSDAYEFQHLHLVKDSKMFSMPGIRFVVTELTEILSNVQNAKRSPDLIVESILTNYMSNCSSKI